MLGSQRGSVGGKAFALGVKFTNFIPVNASGSRVVGCPEMGRWVASVYDGYKALLGTLVGVFMLKDICKLSRWVSFFFGFQVKCDDASEKKYS